MLRLPIESRSTRRSTIDQHSERMPTPPSPEELPPEKALHLIAQAIDDAADRADDDLNSQALKWCDQIESRLGSDAQRSLLDYFRANGWANRAVARRGDQAGVWAWDLEELGQQIFLLRRAVANPAFGQLDPVRRCQMLTNLANQLDTAGRFVESRQIWSRALDLLPTFWMARANRGRSLMHYAHALYDPGHTAVFAMVGHRDLTEALDHIASNPELGDARLKSVFAAHARAIESHFDLAGIRDDYRPDGFALGRRKEERTYRRWCLNAGLFLNVLNDLGPDPIAAHDVLTLPDFVTAIHEPPVLVGFFNQLKQEFVSARWLYFEGVTAEGVHVSDRGVLLYNTLDYPALGLAVEKVKAAYRLCYSLFDKIAFFLNHYMKLGLPERRISFRHVWRDKEAGPVRQAFLASENWPWRGLFWLSKDLYESDLSNVLEPDARALHDLRNHLEHKYVKVVAPPGSASGELTAGASGDTLAHVISSADLERKALKVLQLCRAALIYLSLGMHREEARRRESDPTGVLLMPMPLDQWSDEWKRRR